MKKAILFNFNVDRKNKQIHVERSFNAQLDLVWNAWTKAEILDQWWAPKPWIAKTKLFDFREGGQWVYVMISPDKEEQWGRVDFDTIKFQRFFSAKDGFCDSDGNISSTLPRFKWENSFSKQAQQTLVNILLTFNSLEDLEKIIEIGFKEGFKSGLENLDQYIETQILNRI